MTRHTVILSDSHLVEPPDLYAQGMPHSESTWPKSPEFLDCIFAGVPDDERRQLTCNNAVKRFRFDLG